VSNTTPRILIVGGGYAGFYTAWKLEKHLRRGEAEVTIVDPLPYMTYQPFLPEVAAGSIEARHSVVSLRRHLKRTRVVTAKITGIDHANKVATITPSIGEPWQEEYDQIVVTAGAVSRTFPIPGIADNAIGLKTIEEAVAIRDQQNAAVELEASGNVTIDTIADIARTGVERISSGALTHQATWLDLGFDWFDKTLS